MAWPVLTQKKSCFDFADGSVLVAEGSSNLRSNRNVENLMLCADRGLHDHHAAFIDSMVNQYGG
jgi:hypothetical protein